MCIRDRTLTVPAYSELSVEEIIKGRKAIFSKNYNTAKRVQSLASNGDFDDAKELMKEMSENYKSLLEYFPENTKEGFKTESLPTIWENKDEFNALMIKSSNDMIELISVIDTTDDIRGTIGKLMWAHMSFPIVPLISSVCLLYTSPSPRDATLSRMPSSA